MAQIFCVCCCSCYKKKENCQGTGGTIYADVLEEYMLNAIRNKLSEFKTLSQKKKKQINPKINKNKIRVSEIENEINDLLSIVVGANAVLMQYINEREKK